MTIDGRLLCIRERIGVVELLVCFLFGFVLHVDWTLGLEHRLVPTISILVELLFVVIDLFGQVEMHLRLFVASASVSTKLFKLIPELRWKRTHSPHLVVLGRLFRYQRRSLAGIKELFYPGYLLALPQLLLLKLLGQDLYGIFAFWWSLHPLNPVYEIWTYNSRLLWL